MSNVNSVSLSISITETSSNSDATQNTTQSQQNPFLDPNGPFANLNLTSQQQQQIAQLFSQNSSGQGSSGQSSSGQSSSGSSPWSQILSQLNAILTPQQQQTLQSDLKTLRSGHHHHGDGSSNATNPLSQLDLTSSQQTEIGQIIQAAQTNGDSSSATLNQIDGVLTSSQQQQLVSLFSSDTSAGSSTPGSSTQSSQPYVINTSA
jgi:Spy/CpxP family protein refolding chaperone